MGALQKSYSLKDAAFLAIEAGCDQLLLCPEWNQIEAVWTHLVKAFETGALPMKKLDETIEKIEDAKKRFLMPFKFADIDEAKKTVGSAEYFEVAKAILEGRVVESGPSTKETKETTDE